MAAIIHYAQRSLKILIVAQNLSAIIKDATTAAAAADAKDDKPIKISAAAALAKNPNPTLP